MFKGLGSIASLLSQAQTLGPKMEQMASELKSKTVTGSAGGGMVNVTANGLGQVISIEFDPLLVDKGDMEMAKDLLPAAINQALAKSKQLHLESMQGITGGISLPGLDQALNQLGGQFAGESADEPTDDPQSPPAHPLD